MGDGDFKTTGALSEQEDINVSLAHLCVHVYVYILRSCCVLRYSTTVNMNLLITSTTADSPTEFVLMRLDCILYQSTQGSCIY